MILRKAITSVPIATIIHERVNPGTGLTELDVESKPKAGLPGETSSYVLNGEPKEYKHSIYGKVRESIQWRKLEELDSDYLRQGFESGTTEVILSTMEHLENGTTTDIAYGFEVIDGVRYHTRRIFGKKGDEAILNRVVYDWVGPAPSKK